MKSISELRQDIVSGDWVVIATGRAKRPHDFLKQKRVAFVQKKKDCPFEILHDDALELYSPDGEKGKHNWWVQVIPNKYPAFGKGLCAVFRRVGPYPLTDGVGFHEVIITRDHTRAFADMSDTEAERVMRAYQDRYFALKDEECVEYISLFHNHGRGAGATITHPHSQLIAIPVIPPDVGKSLKGSADYFRRHRTCVHCLMIRYELRAHTRIIYENDYCIVYAPYASRTAFEIRVFPKHHRAQFELMNADERFAIANALRVALVKLKKGLNNPDYNFFLHTAPTKNTRKFDHYHWHFEIVPKTAIWAGFEIGTGIEISTITPEAAARFLRNVGVKNITR